LDRDNFIEERKMRALLSALKRLLFGQEPAPTSEPDRPVELIQAAEEAEAARRRLDFWVNAQKSGITQCISASAWARDTVERRERQPWPTRMPSYIREWLQGLTVPQLSIVGRTHPELLYNHMTFPYVRGCLIGGLPKRASLPPCELEFPKSSTPLADFAERRSGGGGGQKVKPGRDLREVAGYSSRGMR
jgi:hypothetical protein